MKKILNALLGWASVNAGRLIAILVFAFGLGFGGYFLFLYFPTQMFIGLGVIAVIVFLTSVGYLFKTFGTGIKSAWLGFWSSIMFVFRAIGKGIVFLFKSLGKGVGFLFTVIGGIAIIAFLCAITWLVYLYNPIAGVITGILFGTGLLLYAFRKKMRAYLAARKAASTTTTTTGPSWWTRNTTAFKAWVARMKAKYFTKSTTTTTTTTPPGFWSKQTLEKYGWLVIAGIVIFAISRFVGSPFSWISNFFHNSSSGLHIAKDTWWIPWLIALIILVIGGILLYLMVTKWLWILGGTLTALVLLLVMNMWRPWEKNVLPPLASQTVNQGQTQLKTEAKIEKKYLLAPVGKFEFYNITDSSNYSVKLIPLDSIVVIRAIGDTMYGIKLNDSVPARFYKDKKGKELANQFYNVGKVTYGIKSIGSQTKNVLVKWGPSKLFAQKKK